MQNRSLVGIIALGVGLALGFVALTSYLLFDAFLYQVALYWFWG